MKPVTIKYRPISFIPAYRTVSGNFPQNWGEVSAKQLIAIACIYKNRISDLAFLKTMSGLPIRILKRTDDYERFKLMEQLEFISDRRAFHEFIIRKLDIFKYAPNLFRDSILYAPEGKLKGVTFGQFIFADTYFSNYQASQDEDDLNKFIAALYLRPKISFEEKLIQCNYRYIGKIDRSTREAIAINYSLIREWLALAYPLIFQRKTEQEFISNAEEKPKHDQTAWIKIFENFVGDDMLHYDDWAARPINHIFSFMTRKYKENARGKN